MQVGKDSIGETTKSKGLSKWGRLKMLTQKGEGPFAACWLALTHLLDVRLEEPPSFERTLDAPLAQVCHHGSVLSLV
jgi:hypothetical protein